MFIFLIGLSSTFRCGRLTYYSSCTVSNGSCRSVSVIRVDNRSIAISTRRVRKTILICVCVKMQMSTAMRCGEYNLWPWAYYMTAGDERIFYFFRLSFSRNSRGGNFFGRGGEVRTCVCRKLPQPFHFRPAVTSADSAIRNGPLDDLTTQNVLSGKALIDRGQTMTAAAILPNNVTYDAFSTLRVRSLLLLSPSLLYQVWKKWFFFRLLCVRLFPEAYNRVTAI